MVEPDAKAVAFLKNMRVLEPQRGVWEAHWQESADYVVPRKADITKRRTAGAKRTQLIFDGTAIHALELLSSSLHGMLTSASTAWFTLGFSNPALHRDDKAKEWLEEVKQSKLLTGNELRELRTFVYALTESRFEFDANVRAIEALNINNWTPSHQDWVL